MIGQHPVAVIGVMSLVVIIAFTGWPRVIVDESLSGNFELVKYVILKYPALNVADKAGRNPLHFSGVSGDLKLVKYLLLK
ncbi:MAG: hypothetical protein K0U93_01275, partial [Gammaproteobacteria bacterium]|nr:hypothetical protein [Gammaproteobacteria bacterium]